MENDKPINMPVTEYVIRKYHLKTDIPYTTLEAVVSHQLSSAKEAMKIHNSVEISGFGKFLFKKHKVERKLASLQEKYDIMLKAVDNVEFSEKRRQSYRNRCSTLKPELEVLQERITNIKNELQRNSRGVEESSNPSPQAEGAHITG